MRALTQFVMRGPLQASAVAAITMLVPLLFWISAAVVGLVILRLGIRQGINVGLWALLPALGWGWVGQDPSALAVLLEVVLMASLVRSTHSWQQALVAGSTLAVVIGALLPMVYPALLDQLVQTGVSFYQQYNAEVARALGDQLEPAIRQAMNASMAGIFLLTGVGLTMLARSWQAGLYNPGGFRKEFHALRLSWPVATLCAVAMVAGPSIGLNPVLIIWAGGLPLLIAGIALVHGVIGLRRMGTQWLVMFYIALLLLGPSLMLLLLVLAIVDSWLDIRGRLTPTEPAE